MNDVLVFTAAAAITPYGMDVQSFVTGIREGAVSFRALEPSTLFTGGVAMPKMACVPDYDPRVMLKTRSVSQYDRLTLHLCVVTDQLHEQLGFQDLERRRDVVADERISIVVGSSGPIQSVADFDLQAVRDPQFVQPSMFPNVVFNVSTSYAALRRSVRGSCVTLTDGLTSSLKAIDVGAHQITAGRIDLALVGAAEEATAAYGLYRWALARSSDEQLEGLSEGAVMFALERAECATARNQPVLARLLASTHVFCPDPVAGFSECIKRIKHDAPGAGFDVICTESNVDMAALGLEGVRRLSWNERVGDTGAMYGVTAVLAVLATSDVAIGEQVLILQACGDGVCAALLLEKTEQLR